MVQMCVTVFTVLPYISICHISLNIIWTMPDFNDQGREFPEKVFKGRTIMLPNQYPNQYEEYTSGPFGDAVPKAVSHNPKGALRIADLAISIEGELVPVVDIMLGNQMSIYFEHHILLWKHANVQIGFKSLKGMAKRIFAGLQVFVTEAHGPGNIAMSRDSVGQIVALRLATWTDG